MKNIPIGPVVQVITEIVKTIIDVLCERKDKEKQKKP